MKIIFLERETSGPQPYEHRVVLSDQLPPRERITAAFALAFTDGKLLMADLTRRGLDIPGGHLDSGEEPEDAMRREVHEETGARIGAAIPLGYEEYRLLGPAPPDYPFPYPDSYMVFYAAQVASMDHLAANTESQGRVLLDSAAAEQVAWVQKNRELYEAALQATWALGAGG